MNAALLSSKNMCWCTPQDFFEELNREFHFDLDPAATDKSAKCAKYYTPADDGLSKDWGGTACSAILRTVEAFKTGYEKPTKKAESRAPLWLCSFLPEPTQRTSTTTYFTARQTRYASSGDD